MDCLIYVLNLTIMMRLSNFTSFDFIYLLFIYMLLFFIFYFLLVPAISQHYTVPHPSSTVGSAREMRNNNAVYSLWSYFLDFLVSDPASVIRIPRLVIPPDALDIMNRHTGRRRLNIFMAMSKGKTADSIA